MLIDYSHLYYYNLNPYKTTEIFCDYLNSYA